jgi:hypothetical protein
MRSPNWKGGRRIDRYGYVLIWSPGHPRKNSSGCVREHILVVERALGHHLPHQAEIHHVNLNKSDNRPENLVLCPNRGYHVLLHLRRKALLECGHPALRQCNYCHRYDAPSRMYGKPRPTQNGTGRTYRHLECFNRYRRERNMARSA